MSVPDTDTELEVSRHCRVPVWLGARVGSKLVPLAGQFTQCPRGKLGRILEPP